MIDSTRGYTPRLTCSNLVPFQSPFFFVMCVCVCQSKSLEKLGASASCSTLNKRTACDLLRPQDNWLEAGVYEPTAIQQTVDENG